MSLEAALKARIAAHGPVPVEAVFAEAVAAYYARGTAFGRGGDFITAPEVSQVFGELLGLWAAVVWQTMGSPPALILAELGPGRGTLMADALRATAGVPGFHAACAVHLVETSPALRAIQRQALPGRAVVWHERVADLPADRPLIVLANEFFDALPIRQWVRSPDGWRQRCVGLDGDGESLTFVPGPPVDPAEAAALGPAFAAAPPGTIAETCPAARAVAAELGRRLAAQGGAGLIIDYGYAESAPGDTLQAVKGHAFAPVLRDLGAADLTAHVDFARLAAAATAAGAQAWGPVGQGRFLVGLGAEPRATALARAARSPEQALAVVSGVRRLINPTEMGTLFKVLALTHPSYPAPPGFAVPWASPPPPTAADRERAP